MTVEQINQKLERLMAALDQAIEEMDITKVDEIVNSKMGRLIKNAKGQENDVFLAKLNERIDKIAQEIRPENGLSVEEITDLAAIRQKIQTGKEPFQKTEDVIKTLTERGFSQEDLRNQKETQRNDNLAQINGIKHINDRLASRIADIEARYIDPIKDNNEIIKMIQKMQQNKSAIAILDASMDAARISQIKSDIGAIISDLSAKGIDVTSLNDFENNLSVIDAFAFAKIPALETDSNQLAAKIGSDPSIPMEFKNRYDLTAVLNADMLKSKYGDMTTTRQRNASKITVLENENQQLESTIKKFDWEKNLQSFVRNADGSVKKDDEIEQEILGNSETRSKVENVVNERFSNPNHRILFPRLRDRMDYFKETSGKNGVWATIKAFGKAVSTSTKSTKVLAEHTEAVIYGKKMDEYISKKMQTRDESFRKSIRAQVQEKRANDPTLTADRIRNDVLEKANDEASR